LNLTARAAPVSPATGDPRHAGMPPIDLTRRPLSFFEFWPPRLFYFPASLYWLWLSVRHGSLTLPTVANPGLPGGGLSGESKSEVLSAAGPKVRALIAPYVVVAKGLGAQAADAALEAAGRAMAQANLDFPLVAKPDIGCRGAGVQVVRRADDLRAYVGRFPEGAKFHIQKLVDQEGEAGVFYVRHPTQEKGSIPSLTLKYFPHVTGDGKRTLRELILDDPRAKKIAHVFLPRHRARLEHVLAAGERFRLAFAGNHARGTIFRDGTPLVTEALRARIDELAHDIKGFHFGRFDIRFAEFSELLQGRSFTIIEFNGAGAEFTHFWDPKHSIFTAYGEMFRQYRTVFEVAAANRALGHRSLPLKEVERMRRHEERLTKLYPETQ
jgi:hypothetical protein